MPSVYMAHAYNWHVNRFDTDVPIGRYVDGWGRPGDTALLAIEGGHRIGAGWFRLFRAAAPGYGFVDDATPELTIVVVPSRQGQGIGQLLLAGLIERAQADAYRGLSVSVEAPRHRLNSTERRAALLAEIAGEQDRLKTEAAERRAKRAGRDAQKGKTRVA